MTETNPPNRRSGYARVSTVGRTLDTQLEQLRIFDIGWSSASDQSRPAKLNA
jgi:hypothetical protein